MSRATATPLEEQRLARGEVIGGLNGSAQQEAGIDLPNASVQIWNFDLFSSQRRELREGDFYRLDLCLNRRLPDAGIRFADHWAPHRLERPGKLFLVPPRQTLQVRSGVGRQHVILCRLPAERVRDWLDADPDWNPRRLEASFDLPCQTLGALLLRLGDEARRPGFAGGVMVEALAIQLAVEVERYYREIGDLSGSSGLATWRLRAIEERLRDYPAPPSLVELAQICRLSVRQLARSFKAARGVSLGSYVAQCRAEAAKELLDRGVSVKVVAASMGFATPSSFGYAFRKATGVSPSAYRARPGRAPARSKPSDSGEHVRFS
jgi:AraC family transcriptional regulator